jgi:hypothetical protein
MALIFRTFAALAARAAVAAVTARTTVAVTAATATRATIATIAAVTARTAVTARFARRASVFELFAGFLVHDAHRQANLAARIDLEDLDLDFLAFGQDVSDLLDALVGDFADVDETVLAAHEIHERTEIDEVDDLAVVDLADFGFFDDARNPLASGFDLVEVDEAILIRPSSSMSTLAPVVATISRITLPPVPMTSRIFDLSICIVSMRGACADSSVRASPSAFAISPRMCARPSFAWFRAASKISR